MSFFTLDGSVKYDAYIAGGSSPSNRIIEEDVVAINTSMRARSPHGHWQQFFDAGEDLPELAAIDTTWDLLEMPDSVWEEAAVPLRLEALFDVVVGPGIGISRATKVLHIKRPALISVCDSYVLNLLGIPGQSTASGVAALVHLRNEGRRHLDRLQDLRDRLREELGVSRTLVRILDVLIWGSHPDTWVAQSAGQSDGPAPD
jgi:hypothetical protein